MAGPSLDFLCRNTSWGSDIDLHNAVIRLNNAPVVGFEADVGKRTTVNAAFCPALS